MTTMVTTRESNLFLLALDRAFDNPESYEMKQISMLLREINPQFDGTTAQLEKLTIDEIDWLEKRYAAEARTVC